MKRKEEKSNKRKNNLKISKKESGSNTSKSKRSTFRK
jgi:hypothetical protein